MSAGGFDAVSVGVSEGVSAGGLDVVSVGVSVDLLAAVSVGESFAELLLSLVSGDFRATGASGPDGPGCGC